MTDQRPVPPDFDPDASITHVKYEYDMAVATATLLSSGGDRSTAETFALLESFLVHARNLHDFFRPRSEAAIANREYPRHFSAGSVWALDFVPGFGVETFDAEAIARSTDGSSTSRRGDRSTTTIRDGHHRCWPIFTHRWTSSLTLYRTRGTENCSERRIRPPPACFALPVLFDLGRRRAVCLMPRERVWRGSLDYKRGWLGEIPAAVKRLPSESDRAPASQPPCPSSRSGFAGDDS